MNDLARGMAKAARLTRSGRLNEATTLIQLLLRPGSSGATQAPDAGTVDGGAVIDGEFARLDPAPKARARQTKSRSPLGETLRKIAAGGMPGKARAKGAPPAVAPGAQFLALTHVSDTGSRDYKLYVPAGRSTAPMPLIIMLHGCTQTPDDFAVGTQMNLLAEEFGCLVAYPAQPTGANMQKCWNWYRPEDQERDRGEPALIAGLTRDIQHGHGADPARTYVMGLSAGGAAAVLVAAAYPDLFSAVGVHSGLPAGGARDIPSAFAAMRGGAAGKRLPAAVPTIVFHGTADSTVHPDNGTAVFGQAAQSMPGLTVTARQGVSDGGRGYRVTAHVHKDGRSMAEHWQIEGAGHAWAGGDPAGSYTDASGPDASRQMLRFLLQHKMP